MSSTAPDAPLARLCSRQGCRRDALFTLTYVYADSTAVIGPLSVHNEPHAYDLCAEHAQRLTAPRGWEILRLDAQETPQHRDAALHASVTRLPTERAPQSPDIDHDAPLPPNILTGDTADTVGAETQDTTADQPRGMRVPHLRRRAKRHM
ncbi:MAG: DUF3499 family protein [Kocuria sp.]|nr:DUF3499 family protein [Kocuria sp.]